MNKPTAERRHHSRCEWLIAVQADRVVPAATFTGDDEDLDWDQTTLTLTLHGTLQSGFDLSDAIESAATLYSLHAHRDRHSNRSLAKSHSDLADRMTLIASELEQQLNIVLNVDAGATLVDEQSQDDANGGEHGDR